MSKKAQAASQLHRPEARPPAARSKRGKLLLVGLALLAGAGYFAWRALRPLPWLQSFRVVAEHPHDPAAYCQGLVFDGGLLHESTGLRGQSSVRTVEIATGKVLRKRDLAPQFFGEGLALAGGKLFQLTWQEHVVHVYDARTLEPVGTLDCAGEGWGLTFDGKSLILSDGSDALSFRDPQTFAETHRVRVRAQGRSLAQLNELEFVDGEVWANVWKEDFIARIDPATGAVVGLIDLRGLFDHRVIQSQDAVLNGIAFDAQSKRLFVTGKLWPKLFEIEVVAK